MRLLIWAVLVVSACGRETHLDSEPEGLLTLYRELPSQGDPEPSDSHMRLELQSASSCLGLSEEATATLGPVELTLQATGEWFQEFGNPGCNTPWFDAEGFDDALGTSPVTLTITDGRHEIELTMKTPLADHTVTVEPASAAPGDTILLTVQNLGSGSIHPDPTLTLTLTDNEVSDYVLCDGPQDCIVDEDAGTIEFTVPDEVCGSGDYRVGLPPVTEVMSGPDAWEGEVFAYPRDPVLTIDSNDPCE